MRTPFFILLALLLAGAGCGDGIDTGRADLTVTDGLVQWYRANQFTSQGSGAAIGSWPGVGFTGPMLFPNSGTIYHYLTGGGSNSPSFSYVSLSGAPYFRGTSGLGSGQSEFSIYAVLSTTTDGELFGLNENFSGTYPSTCGTNATSFFAVSRVSGSYSACIGNVATYFQAMFSGAGGSPQIHEIHWSSNDTLQYRVAGLSSSTVSTPNFANLSLAGSLTIGALNTGAAASQIYEVIVYSKKLDEDDATKVRRYLSSRYQVTQD
jgi:hypothetical protein